MKTQTLYLEDLEKATCNNPGCKHENHSEIFLTQMCHPRAGCEVAYLFGQGIVRVTCKECDLTVVNIPVGSRQPQTQPARI